MRRLSFLFINLLITNNIFAQPLPEVSSGSIKRIDSFSSYYVTARNIDVWLPDGYSTKKKYAVLYMQDGQMLFDSNATWNHKTWDVDDVLTKLKKENTIRDVIVVGIWNTGKERHADYFPQKPFEMLTAIQQEYIYKAVRANGDSVFNGFKIHSDNYLKFLVKELKPYIDSTFSVYTNPKNTFISGSSMGGLISIYAICEYPNIFGGAACLSTHWPGIFTMINNPIPAVFIKYLKTHLPDPKKNKIYFDHGDQILDAMYPPLQKKVDEVMKAKGFTEKSWVTKNFPGENHSEIAWGKRFNIPMLFLLKKK